MKRGGRFFVGHPTIKNRGHCDSNQTYIRGLVWVIFRLCYINMYIYISIYIYVCVCVTKEFEKWVLSIAATPAQ